MATAKLVAMRQAKAAETQAEQLREVLERLARIEALLLDQAEKPAKLAAKK